MSVDIFVKLQMPWMYHEASFLFDQTHHKAKHKEYEKHKEQNPCDIRRAFRNVSKPEDGSNNRDDKKDNGPSKHDKAFLKK
jgi:hypothetical protein